MTDTFNCPACGAPNDPMAGATQMACSYCGANLTIPKEMRRAFAPQVDSTPARVTPAPRPEIDASEILRQAQPVAAKAWNTYAWWTWIRRMLPACLIIVVIGLCACGALTALPFFLRR